MNQDVRAALATFVRRLATLAAAFAIAIAVQIAVQVAVTAPNPFTRVYIYGPPALNAGVVVNVAGHCGGVETYGNPGLVTDCG